MKKNVIKTTFAAVCVIGAGMGGLKAYNAANQSEADMLLSENIDALSAGDASNDYDYVYPKVKDARPVEMETSETHRIKAEAGVPGLGKKLVKIGGEYYYEWTVKKKYHCNDCVKGNTYRWCSDIPNRC